MINVDLLEKNLPNIKICCYYDLLRYDHNMGALYYELKSYLTKRFSNGEVNFATNERLVFLHCDNDFFIDADFPGLILYNLQIILSELNIPNHFCKIISQLPHYQIYTKLVQKKLTHDPVPIGAITSIYSKLLHLDLDEVELNHSKVKKLFLIGSRLSRFHRTFFMSQLFSNNLQDIGYVNYYNIPAEADVENTSSNKLPVDYNPCHFLSGIPFTRHNPVVLIKDSTNRNIVSAFQQSVNSYSNFDPIGVIDNKTLSTEYQWLELQNALIYVGLEAVVNCPQPYHDEISFKGIGAKRPFILFGTPYLLSHLRDLGFKTFNDYWDESYDTVLNLEDRVTAIMKLLTSLSTMSESAMQQLILDMQTIIEHNFYHLKNVLPNQEFEKILNGIAN